MKKLQLKRRVGTFYGFLLTAMFATQFSCAASFPVSQTNDNHQISQENMPNEKIPDDWQKFNVCKISFLAPKELKNENIQGVDSCIASFKSGKMEITLDYGWYGGAAKSDKSKADFKEDSIEIDGRKAQIATFRELETKTNFKYFADLYVVLIAPNKENPMTTSLDMGIRVESEKDLETAKNIFQSIRFDK